MAVACKCKSGRRFGFVIFGRIGIEAIYQIPEEKLVVREALIS